MLIKRPDSEINLSPKECQSDREKPREPIFGRGAPHLLAELVVTAGALGLLLLIVLFAGSLKERAYGLMFGEPQQRATAPGAREGVTSNGVHWKVTE